MSPRPTELYNSHNTSGASQVKVAPPFTANLVQCESAVFRTSSDSVPTHLTDLALSKTCLDNIKVDPTMLPLQHARRESANQN